jgi:hypothetical protein
MATTLDIEQTRNQARALLDSRIESVTALVKTRQRITDLESGAAARRRKATNRATGESPASTVADETHRDH